MNEPIFAKKYAPQHTKHGSAYAGHQGRLMEEHGT